MKASRSQSALYNAKVLFKRLLSSKSAIEGNFVHPCVIKGRESLVHAHDLEQRDPSFYQQLQQYAATQNVALIADRRSKEISDRKGRRQAWLPVIVLSLSLNNSVTAGNNASHSSPKASQSVLNLLHPASNMPIPVQQTLAPTSDESHFEYELPPNEHSAQIEEILQQHYSPKPNQPAHIDADLIQIARYLSQYPDSVALLLSLADQPWQLQYAENTFETEVRGNAFKVQAVNIRFDTRAAARLRKHRDCKTNANACIASPADALLHELLHAQSALLDTQQFIAQGGMSSVLYPYAHEHNVIKNENRIYRAMSALDGVPRPQRHSHAGRLVASSCSFCIQ